MFIFKRLLLKINPHFENKYMKPSTEYHKRYHTRGIAIFVFPHIEMLKLEKKEYAIKRIS